MNYLLRSGHHVLSIIVPVNNHRVSYIRLRPPDVNYTMGENEFSRRSQQSVCSASIFAPIILLVNFILEKLLAIDKLLPRKIVGD